jgi:hypothetical protein
MRTAATLILLLFVNTLIWSQVPSYVPSQGLLTWYSFSGNSNDLSGNGNHLTNNNASLSADRNGSPSSAYSFNGTNSYLINNAPGFIFASTSSFTVSFWMLKPTTAAAVMLMHGTTAAGNFIYNFQTNSSSGLQFGTNKQQSPWFWAQATYTSNVWTHVVGVYQNNYMTLYINGTPVANNTFTHTGVTSTTLPLYVGRGVSGNYYNGTLDDIGIWNRALTQAEINGLFTACQPVIGGIANITTCDSYASPSGTTYTSSGTYSDTLQTTLGCDSIITLNLTIKNSSQATETVTRCFRYTSPSGLYTWTSSGTYLDTLQNSMDCDSIITINLTINTVDTSVTRTSAVILTANATNATYRWLNCNQNYALIPGATAKAFTALVNGSYAVEITQNGCVDTSSCYTINSVGLMEDTPALLPRVYPNPGSGFISIINLPETAVKISIYDLTGKLAHSFIRESSDPEVRNLDLTFLEAGVYFLEISSEVRIFTIKLIVRK